MLKYFALATLVIVSCAPQDKPAIAEGFIAAPLPIPPTPEASREANADPRKAATLKKSATELVWHQAVVTWYEAYPEPGSEECVYYNGCNHMGSFSALDERMPESWVKANNIASVHSKDFEQYRLKKLRVRQGSQQIDVTVYDMCADSDCNGCCSEGLEPAGFLIDLESYTSKRFGKTEGIVEWTCLDCQ